MLELTRYATAAVLVAGSITATTLADDEILGQKVDPKADDIVKKMVEHYGDAAMVSCDSHLAMLMAMGEMKQEPKIDIAFAAKAPNQFSFRMSDERMEMHLISDGTHVYTAAPKYSKYMQAEAPTDFDSLSDEVAMMTNITGAGEFNMVLGLLGENGYDSVMTGVNELSYVGDETINDVETNHIKLVREDIDLDIWVQAGEAPWIVRMVPDMQKAITEMAQGSPNMGEMRAEATLTFANWSSESPANDPFAFATASAKKVESFEELGPDPVDPDDLVKKPAPNFTLKKLGSDSEITLADHKGKDIVVLDFWATWCPPCIAGLPTMDEVTKKYADKNVVFYAVDLMEDEETVKQTMARRSWDFNVLFDPTGEVAHSFGVGPIPHSVIIAKDGRVATYHIGLLPDLSEQLSKELDKLIEDGEL